MYVPTIRLFVTSAVTPCLSMTNNTTRTRITRIPMKGRRQSIVPEIGIIVPSLPAKRSQHIDLNETKQNKTKQKQNDNTKKKYVSITIIIVVVIITVIVINMDDSAIVSTSSNIN
mmetsp:Transcript_17077/g.19522  ORF Transcript_17077/g.19522 Transcript_17077/m.19522 type:complete len:115 (-) Transcript_17077:712-1056(-)